MVRIDCDMRIAIPRERVAGERRVALIPETVSRLVNKGHEVVVEHDAGIEAGHDDAAYTDSGATIGADTAATLLNADLVVCIQRPGAEGGLRVEDLASGQAVLSMLSPLDHPEGIKALADHGVTALSLERIPRISRAQSMDVLSSMSTVAGYRAAMIGAQTLGRFFPLLMTAAGTVAPAKVLVLGAGVAGLQAIATARRLGAVVSAYDTRSVVKEQVESLGAKFVVLPGSEDAEAAGGYARELTAEELATQQAALADHIAGSDVVITTALVPGRKAPLLIPTNMVEGMRLGSVIVDLAGEAGGNCELSKAGENVIHNGVTICAPMNLPATMPTHASQLFAKNVENLLGLLAPESALDVEQDDEIAHATCVAHKGEVLDPVVRELLGMPELAKVGVGDDA